LPGERREEPSAMFSKDTRRFRSATNDILSLNERENFRVKAVLKPYLNTEIIKLKLLTKSINQARTVLQFLWNLQKSVVFNFSWLPKCRRTLINFCKQSLVKPEKPPITEL